MAVRGLVLHRRQQLLLLFSYYSYHRDDPCRQSHSPESAYTLRHSRTISDGRSPLYHNREVR